MAKLDLALVVRTVDQASRPLRRIQKTVRDLGRQTGLDRVGRQTRLVGRQMWRVGGEARKFATRMGLALGLVGGVIGKVTLRSAAQMEQMRVAFESMLGSPGAALEMVKRLTTFAARTPFQIQGIGASAKQLLAFGVQADDIVPTLQMLGDIAAGAGVPLQDMAQIFGKSMAKGKAQTEELNQMAERGVPILDALVKLAATYGNEMSKEDVYKAAETGNISFKAVSEALALMTAEGGIFHKQMDKQSKTLFGLLSTVKDNVFNVTAVIGDSIERAFGVKAGMRDFITWLKDLNANLKLPVAEQTGAAKEITAALADIVEMYTWIKETITEVIEVFNEWHNWLSENVPMYDETVGKLAAWAKELGAVKAAAILLAAFIGKGLIVALVGLIAPLTTLAALLIANPFVLLVAALAGGVYLIYDNWDGIVKYFEDIWKGIKNAFDLEWLTQARSLVVSAAPSGVAPRGRGGLNQTPSLFTPEGTADTASPGRRGPGRGRGNANITVDFRNMPRGTRTETRADSDTDLEVTTGYAMQGAW